MEWAALALSVCACDSALQLRPTELADAERPDAVGMCPAMGLPTFQSALREIALGCTQYNVSVDTGTAAALCGVRSCFGPADTQPVPLVISGATNGYLGPRVTPEGDEIWFREVNPSNALVAAATAGAPNVTITRTFTLSTFALPNGVWLISTPTRAPTRHLIYVDLKALPMPKFRELVEISPSVLADAAAPTMANIDGGFLNIGSVGLTDDGLRLVFDATMPGLGANVWYSQRPTIDATFPAPVPLGVPPDANHPFLRSDCGRLYFDAVGAVFYLPEG